MKHVMGFLSVCLYTYIHMFACRYICMLVLYKQLKTPQGEADFPAILPSHPRALLKCLTSPRKPKDT